jgi:hypothetical protein
VFRLITFLYALLAIALVATSYYTTRRAKSVSGEDHYWFTQSHILLERYVPPRNATDAAIDVANENDEGEEPEAGAGPPRRPGFMTVDEPLFVLGFLDVTCPFIVTGGISLFAVAIIRNKRKNGGNPCSNSTQTPSS